MCIRPSTNPLDATLRDKIVENIVKTFALQALADLADRDAAIRAQVIPLLEDVLQNRSPAMKSRARKLLAQLSR